ASGEQRAGGRGCEQRFHAFLRHAHRSRNVGVAPSSTIPSNGERRVPRRERVLPRRGAVAERLRRHQHEAERGAARIACEKRDREVDESRCTAADAQAKPRQRRGRDVTEVKSGPALYKAAHSTLRAVMRRNGALAADYARRHGVARWHDDADAILRADDIDAVYVATLPDTHCDYVLRCAAAGKPVYVEKPMAMNPAECAAMIAACAKARVPLFVAYYRRAL